MMAANGVAAHAFTRATLMSGDPTDTYHPILK